jgi:hypothetical protein
MKDKVSISDINIPNNFKDIKTNYKITLYDKDTGEEVYSTDGHNKLNPNIGLRPWSLTYGAALTSSVQVNWSNYLTYEYPTGIYFYNSEDDPSTNHPGGPQRGQYLGAGQLGSSNSAADRCSYNPNESKYEIVYEDGIAYMHKHIVMDATTSQLNGQINTVVIGASRYISVNGVYESGLYVTTPTDNSSTLYDYNKPQYGQNTSLMSFHPDRPTWQTSQSYDSGAIGSWSFESDNTSWFSPYRKSAIASVDDIVLFHYDLNTWKVLDVIKLSLPEECIGKELIAYKFDDCIAVYRRYSSSYSEDSSGNPYFTSEATYIFNLNGDYVKTVNKGLYTCNQSQMVAIEDKLYYWPAMTYTNYRSLIVFDPELNLLDGLKMEDYMNDSRFGSHSSSGKYRNYIKPVILLDNITGERKLLLNGVAGNYAGPTNLIWDINKGQAEWLPQNSIYTKMYNFIGLGTSYYIPVVINGLPKVLSTGTNSFSPWPFIWHHWCKLPSAVTKTANTTMKIQIDLYYPIVSPFAFAAPPDTAESTTES